MRIPALAPMRRPPRLTDPQGDGVAARRLGHAAGSALVLRRVANSDWRLKRPYTCSAICRRALDEVHPTLNLDRALRPRGDSLARRLFWMRCPAFPRELRNTNKMHQCAPANISKGKSASARAPFSCRAGVNKVHAVELVTEDHGRRLRGAEGGQ